MRNHVCNHIECLSARKDAEIARLTAEVARLNDDLMLAQKEPMRCNTRRVNDRGDGVTACCMNEVGHDGPHEFREDLEAKVEALTLALRGHMRENGAEIQKQIDRAETAERELAELRAAVRWLAQNDVRLMTGSKGQLMVSDGKISAEHAEALRRATT